MIDNLESHLHVTQKISQVLTSERSAKFPWMILEALASLKTMLKIKWMSHLSDIASDRLNSAIKQYQRQRQARSANLAHLLGPILGFFVCVWISYFLSEWQGNKTSWTNVYSLLSKTTSNRNKETHLATSDLIDNRQLFKLSGCLRNYVSSIICSLSIFLKPWWEAIYITESQTSRRIRAIGKMPVGIAWWSKINQTLVSWFLAISNYKIRTLTAIF